jgi:hypothetical protein
MAAISPPRPPSLREGGVFAEYLFAIAAVVMAACSDSGGGGATDATGGGTTSSTGGGPADGGAGIGGAIVEGGAPLGGAPATGGGGADTGGTGGTGGAVEMGGEGGTGPGSVCGNGIVEAGETCDDGVITSGCDTFADGGNGACVQPGTCSPGYVLANTMCVPELAQEHVHIDVDNFCNMIVMATEYFVPAGQKLKLSYHNHSVDYPVDVWMMYGGGYTDLQPGATWNEQYEHCFGPQPSTGYADISTACSEYRLYIHCL